MIFEHILVPYDGSAPAEHALDKAIRLVRIGAASKLSVAHVVNLQPVVISDITFVQPDVYKEQVKEHGDAVIDKVKEKTGDLHDVQVVILAGSPAEAIVDYANGNGCDLIAMGSRGLSSLREFMVGSVSHNVILHASVPVMIMK
ncbi:universal stress protein [Cohnella suwonensis]|uniref:Universal stress protein n=1 Tax=Cohnella suwonensis TaxID=696072 RepID=A0ABW0LQ78_9BACL